MYLCVHVLLYTIYDVVFIYMYVHVVDDRLDECCWCVAGSTRVYKCGVQWLSGWSIITESREWWCRESAGGVVVTTSAYDTGGTGSIPGTGCCDIKIWLSTLGTVYAS